MSDDLIKPRMPGGRFFGGPGVAVAGAFVVAIVAIAVVLMIVASRTDLARDKPIVVHETLALPPREIHAAPVVVEGAKTLSTATGRASPRPDSARTMLYEFQVEKKAAKKPGKDTLRFPTPQ